MKEFLFYPELPLVDKNDRILDRTLDNIPFFTIKDGKILLPDANDEKLLTVISCLDKALNSNNFSEYIKYAAKDNSYAVIYNEMLKRLKPKYTVISITGPFTLANLVFNKQPSNLLLDNAYRKFLIQVVTIKALSYIAKVKAASPSTTPIIMFEEDLLYKYGSLKRTNEYFTSDTVVSMLSKVYSNVQKAGGLVGVKSFEKCNWKLVFEAGNVNMISFDAYNNPNNLNIIANDVNKFLAGGGYINWAIIPVGSENSVKNLTFDSVYKRLIYSIESLASEGVPADLLYKNATMSVQGNLADLPILFAEKALMIANQVSKKLPFSSAS